LLQKKHRVVKSGIYASLLIFFWCLLSCVKQENHVISECDKSTIYENFKFSDQSFLWIKNTIGDTLHFENEDKQLKSIVLKEIINSLGQKNVLLRQCKQDTHKLKETIYYLNFKDYVFEDINGLFRIVLRLQPLIDDTDETSLKVADLLSFHIKFSINEFDQRLMEIITWQRDYPFNLNSPLQFAQIDLLTKVFYQVYLNTNDKESNQIYYSRSHGFVGLKFIDEKLFVKI